MESPQGVGYVLVRDIVIGTSAVVVASLLAAVVYPADIPAGRILVLAVACGVVASVLTDWRAIAVTNVAAAIVFVYVLAPHSAYGSGWAYTPFLLLGAVVGAGHRRLRNAEDAGPRPR